MQTFLVGKWALCIFSYFIFFKEKVFSEEKKIITWTMNLYLLKLVELVSYRKLISLPDVHSSQIILFVCFQYGCGSGFDFIISNWGWTGAKKYTGIFRGLKRKGIAELKHELWYKWFSVCTALGFKSCVHLFKCSITCT